jgi:hypothetical protein
MKAIWKKALEMADATPESRNRYVDFLRAMSILAVVFGHWLMAAPQFTEGRPSFNHLLDVSPWTQWLTWVFQVMPVFFFVGGFSNSTSWLSAQRKNLSYSNWLELRLKRLLFPVLPLLLLWAAMAVPARQFGVSLGMIEIGSRVALVPIWFLAVYIFVVLLTPLVHALWERYGIGSVCIFVLGAIVVDLAYFVADMRYLGWLNYLFVWLAVHQLGFAWREGLFPKPVATFILGILSFVLLLALVTFGPYPLSLVGVPSDELSNTLPPKLPLLALAGFQIGILISLERVANSLLSNRVFWAAVVLINSMIMTVFLWHSTAMILLMGVSFWQFPNLLSTIPGSTDWWLLRPPWVLAYFLLCLPFVALFMRFENLKAKPGAKPPPAWRLILGSIVACLGLALLAMSGIGADNILGIRIVPFLLPFIGVSIAASYAKVS